MLHTSNDYMYVLSYVAPELNPGCQRTCTYNGITRALAHGTSLGMRLGTGENGIPTGDYQPCTYVGKRVS